MIGRKTTLGEVPDGGLFVVSLSEVPCLHEHRDGKVYCLWGVEKFVGYSVRVKPELVNAAVYLFDPSVTEHQAKTLLNIAPETLL